AWNAATVPAPSWRALVRSSRVPAVGAPSADCAKTQMVSMAMFSSVPLRWCSDDLEALEEGDDLLVALAVVLDDLARLAGLGGGDVDDLLTGARPPDRLHAEVTGLHRVDGLVLGRHDPLEARVAGLDHTGRHRHDGRQRALDLVEAGLGLALHLEGGAVDLDMLGEHDRRPAQH